MLKLLHFKSSSLLWPGKSNTRWTKHLDPWHLHGELGRNSWLLAHLHPSLVLACSLSFPISLPLAFSLCLSLYNSNLQISKSQNKNRANAFNRLSSKGVILNARKTDDKMFNIISYQGWKCIWKPQWAITSLLSQCLLSNSNKCWWNSIFHKLFKR